MPGRFDSPIDDLYFDAPGLRVVPHKAFQIAAAAPAYYVHRDTWSAPIGSGREAQETDNESRGTTLTTMSPVHGGSPWSS